MAARSRVIELCNSGKITLKCRGTVRDEIVADIEEVRKRTVETFQTSQKLTERAFDGITVAAYVAKFGCDPRSKGEHVSPELVDGKLQECVLWSQKGAGEFALKVQDKAGVTKSEKHADSETAVRESDIDTQFTSLANGLVSREGLDDVRVASSSSSGSGAAIVSQLQALGLNLDVKTEASVDAVKQEPQDSESESHGGIGESDNEEEDILARMLGGPKKTFKCSAVKSKAKGKCKAAAKSKAMGNARPSSHGQAGAGSSPGGSGPQKRGLEKADEPQWISKRQKTAGMDIEPSVYLDVNGFQPLREELDVVLARISDNEALKKMNTNEAGVLSALQDHVALLYGCCFCCTNYSIDDKKSNNPKTPDSCSQNPKTPAKA